jgi:hypothetical protein
MKRLALTAVIAAVSLMATGGRPPAGPEANRAAGAGAAHAGYLGSGNHHDSTDAAP